MPLKENLKMSPQWQSLSWSGIAKRNAQSVQLQESLHSNPVFEPSWHASGSTIQSENEQFPTGNVQPGAWAKMEWPPDLPKMVRCVTLDDLGLDPEVYWLAGHDDDESDEECCGCFGNK